MLIALHQKEFLGINSTRVRESVTRRNWRRQQQVQGHCFQTCKGVLDRQLFLREGSRSIYTLVPINQHLMVSHKCINPRLVWLHTHSSQSYSGESSHNNPLFVFAICCVWSFIFMFITTQDDRVTVFQGITHAFKKKGNGLDLQE